jgi:hypothetical protein
MEAEMVEYPSNKKIFLSTIPPPPSQMAKDYFVELDSLTPESVEEQSVFPTNIIPSILDFISQPPPMDDIDTNHPDTDVDVHIEIIPPPPKLPSEAG